MTDNQLKELVNAMKPQQSQQDLKRWALPVIVGLTIAFVGWFANKSSRDIENTATINKTLEFMQKEHTSANTALAAQMLELKQEITDVKDKLGDQFTREDFNREMIYRDQDVKRIQNQVEAIFDKINED